MGDIRLAIVGKGGVGKTTIAGTVARLLARRGRRVLALDLDPNPGLAWSLGITPFDTGVPPGIAEKIPDAPPNAWKLVSGVDASHELERHVTIGPDGVRYLSPGKIDRPSFLANESVFGVREIVRGFDLPGWDVITDIDAATAVSCGQHVTFAQHLLLVATPQPASALTVHRLRDLLAGTPISVMVSMDRIEPSHPGIEAIARIPFDSAVQEADRRGLALVDHAPDCSTVKALDALVTQLMSGELLAAATTTSVSTARAG